MSHIEAKYIYKNFERKQILIDCLENNENEFLQNNLTNIINTEDFNSIMNQKDLKNHHEFDDIRIFFRKSYDSITSVENLIDKLDGCESKFPKELINKNQEIKGINYLT